MNDDKINELYYGKIFDERAQLVARERIHWICRQVEGSQILDIGCSQGIVSILLGREGFFCTGIDIEKQAIKFALRELEKEEEFTKQKVKFLLGDATNLEFEDNSFDTVILGEIIEHFTHPEKILQEAKRVLKEGGKVIITVPFGLNSHPDHKKSYFPVSFLETVRPFFKTLSIDTLHNYITYTGRKFSQYRAEFLTSEEILNEVLSVQKRLEERCIQQELNFENNQKKFIEENKKLHQVVSQLSEEKKVFQLQMTKFQDENRALVEERNALQLQMTKFQDENRALVEERDQTLIKIKALEQRIINLARENEQLQEKLSFLEIRLENEVLTKSNALAYQEKVFKSSMRWRIGSFFVGGARLFKEMILHPFSFAKQYRKNFKEYINEVFPHTDISDRTKKKMK
ncbi:MAG: methyltransferase domain-containing protein [Chloroflexota bacterium]